MAIKITTTKSTASNAKNNKDNTKAAPMMLIKKQYIKKLTFNAERKPDSVQQENQPKIDIKIDVNTSLGSKNPHESILTLNCLSSDNLSKIYEIEFSYIGVFNIENVPDSKIQALLHVEGARLIFPFARRILADLTTDAGFYPVHLDPIDFLALYKHKLAQANKDLTDDTKIN